MSSMSSALTRYGMHCIHNQVGVNMLKKIRKGAENIGNWRTAVLHKTTEERLTTTESNSGEQRRKMQTVKEYPSREKN